MEVANYKDQHHIVTIVSDVGQRFNNIQFSFETFAHPIATTAAFSLSVIVSKKRVTLLEAGKIAGGGNLLLKYAVHQTGLGGTPGDRRQEACLDILHKCAP